jgi:hypothetical protein
MPKVSTRVLLIISAVCLSGAALTVCDGEPNATGPVASVTIVPVSPFVVVTDTLRMTAVLSDQQGRGLIDRGVQWTSNDESKATVSSDGTVSAKAVGSVEITAIAEGKVTKTTVEIIPAPADVTVKNFFMAFSWWGNVYERPVPTQLYDVSQCPENPNAPCLDDNISLYRVQWNDVLDWQTVANWAADPRHRGHLYTVGDDLNAAGAYGERYTRNPALYSIEYCAFVRNVQAAEPTAEFSPTMIQDTGDEAWLNAFAAGVLAEFNSGNCGTNPISEWTFNTYAVWSRGLSAFTDFVARWSTWAASLPAPIGTKSVLGAWVLGWPPRGLDVPNDDPAYVARLREAKAWLFANPNIRMARYLLFEPWPVENSDAHPLTDLTGQLNLSGRAYADVTGRVAGPTAIPPSTACMWTAETTGGSAPYTYEWFVNGALVGTRHWLVHHHTGLPFALQLRVTDAAGGQGTTTLNVSVSTRAPSCRG